MKFLLLNTIPIYRSVVDLGFIDHPAQRLILLVLVADVSAVDASLGANWSEVLLRALNSWLGVLAHCCHSYRTADREMTVLTLSTKYPIVYFEMVIVVDVRLVRF